MAKASFNQRAFLLSFFDPPHTSFALVRVNGFILNRYLNPDGNAFVMVYTEESYENSSQSKHNHSIKSPLVTVEQYQDRHLGAGDAFQELVGRVEALEKEHAA